MKKTKKLFAAVLAAALMAVTAVPAFADNNKITEVNGTASHDVKGTYAAGSASDTVYSVDITWGSMEFTYTAASEGDWDPATHGYKNGTESGTWSCKNSGGDTITVKNHSNAAVKVELTYASESNYSSISGSFDKATLSLATAVGTHFDSAPSGTATLTISGGSLDSSAAEGVKIGTVTVTLNTTA